MPGNGNLDETEFLEIAVQRIRLGIDSDPLMRSEMREDFAEGFGGFCERDDWRAIHSTNGGSL
jgi:hypothetical protein